LGLLFGCANWVSQERLKLIQDYFAAYFQPSLRDWSSFKPNPGLRPGLSSAVPAGLDRSGAAHFAFPRGQVLFVAITLVADQVYEELMDPAIAGELGVEGGG
jgi:hypothetical protein